VEGATGFGAYLEDYDALERELIAAQVRAEPEYYACKLSFKVADVGELL
jgi:hypothetical protein